MPEPKFTVNLDLPVPLFEWLTALSAKDSKSRNGLIVFILEQAKEASLQAEASLETASETRPA
mgnify:CR=1 FL=1